MGNQLYKSWWLTEEMSGGFLQTAALARAPKQEQGGSRVAAEQTLCECTSRLPLHHTHCFCNASLGWNDSGGTYLPDSE